MENLFFILSVDDEFLLKKNIYTFSNTREIYRHHTAFIIFDAKNRRGTSFSPLFSVLTLFLFTVLTAYYNWFVKSFKIKLKSISPRLKISGRRFCYFEKVLESTRDWR